MELKIKTVGLYEIGQHEAVCYGCDYLILESEKVYCIDMFECNYITHADPHCLKQHIDKQLEIASLNGPF